MSYDKYQKSLSLCLSVSLSLSLSLSLSVSVSLCLSLSLSCAHRLTGAPLEVVHISLFYWSFYWSFCLLFKPALPHILCNDPEARVQAERQAFLFVRGNKVSAEL